jgi:hypothetical protein
MGTNSLKRSPQVSCFTITIRQAQIKSEERAGIPFTSGDRDSRIRSFSWKTKKAHPYCSIKKKHTVLVHMSARAMVLYTVDSRVRSFVPLCNCFDCYSVTIVYQIWHSHAFLYCRCNSYS